MEDSSCDANDHTTPLNLGFLTVLHESSGYLGGYLVTNLWGRPLEFRLSTAVQPNRVQQILYGGTLQPYICADLIGKTLVDKTAPPVQLIADRLRAGCWTCGCRSRCRCVAGSPRRRTVRSTTVATATGGRICCHPALLGRRAASSASCSSGSTAARPGRAVRPHPRGGRRGPQDGSDQPWLTTLPRTLPARRDVDLCAAEVQACLRSSCRCQVDVPRGQAARPRRRGCARLGKLALEVSTEGWRFPAPPSEVRRRPKPRCSDLPAISEPHQPPEPSQLRDRRPRRAQAADPPAAARDTVVFKDRLLYLLQPPLENLFAGKQVRLPFQPYPYQLEGIAFLMPRARALCWPTRWAWARRCRSSSPCGCSFHAGLIRRALVVCPKPLVINWSRELRTWAEDVPFEVIGGDADARRAGWLVSNCPLKLVNYELLTRDAALVADEQVALRRGRPRRGPAHQEPRVEDRRRWSAACTATAAGP